MKKSILTAFALIALVSASLTSCNSGKTPEQINAEANAQIEKLKTEWQATADSDCSSKSEAYKTAALDSLKNAFEPAVTQ